MGDMPAVHDTTGAKGRYALGTLFLLMALVAALVLVLQEFFAMRAPGCGAAIDCARASRSSLGHVPGIGLPTCVVGAAWFAGLLAGWWRSRGDVNVTWARVARLGALVSVFLLGALAALSLACPYCLLAHAANLAFVLLLEFGAPASPARTGRSPWPATITAAAVAGTALVIGHVSTRRAVDERAAEALSASLDSIRSQGAPDRVGTTPDPLARTTTAAGGLVTGRHARVANAPVRFVVFTDYQCEDCHDFEERLAALAARTPDVSVAIRHFPMSKGCNPHAADLHPNACWAALAAEAAATIAGDDGFWRLHAWLFARRGAFTNAELDEGLSALGFDRARFLGAMKAPETSARIQEDVAEGMRLGLTSTPMVFVNGVELRGWRTAGALELAVDAARSARSTPGQDRAPEARARYVDLWRSAAITTLPVDPNEHVLGRRDARVQIVVWGDYQEPTTAAVDVELRNLALQRSDVAYTFRAFPVNTACNKVVLKTQYPLACLAALGVQAAARVQGNDGFWALHDWLMTHRDQLDDETMTQAAMELGIARDAFWDALRSPELPEAVTADVEAARAVGVASIPLVFVNGRRVEYWSVGGVSLWPEIVEEAAQGR